MKFIRKRKEKNESSVVDTKAYQNLACQSSEFDSDNGKMQK